LSPQIFFNFWGAKSGNFPGLGAGGGGGEVVAWAGGLNLGGGGGMRSSVATHTGPEAHLACCTMRIWYLARG